MYACPLQQPVYAGSLAFPFHIPVVSKKNTSTNKLIIGSEARASRSPSAMIVMQRPTLLNIARKCSDLWQQPRRFVLISPFFQRLPISWQLIPARVQVNNVPSESGSPPCMHESKIGTTMVNHSRVVNRVSFPVCSRSPNRDCDLP